MKNLKNRSIAAATVGSSGNIAWSEDFSAFGERRDPDDWDGPPGSSDLDTINSNTERGYTFHSNLEESPLIHMNGRVADASLGRFLSADPFVPDPGNTQAYNRYSYVYNNPLSYTDPSGFTPGDRDDVTIDINIHVCLGLCPPDISDGSPGNRSKSKSPISNQSPPARVGSSSTPGSCLVAAQGCYGAASSLKLQSTNADIHSFPVFSALGGLIDLYSCSRIMNNPLVCLFGSPIGGGFGGSGFGGEFGTGVCGPFGGEYCLSFEPEELNESDKSVVIASTCGLYESCQQLGGPGFELILREYFQRTGLPPAAPALDVQTGTPPLSEADIQIRAVLGRASDGCNLQCINDIDNLAVKAISYQLVAFGSVTGLVVGARVALETPTGRALAIGFMRLVSRETGPTAPRIPKPEPTPIVAPK